MIHRRFCIPTLLPYLLFGMFGMFSILGGHAWAAPSNNELTLQYPHNSQSVQSDTTQDIHDIYPPLPLPEHYNWPLIFTLCCAVLLIAGILFYFLRKRKQPAIAAPPPHQKALSELALARQFLVAGQSLAYAERISEILRSYIENRFYIRSTRKTTTEFLSSLTTGKNKDISELLLFKDSLTLCLQQCDLAKYAHKTADKDALEIMEESIRKFIEETVAKEEK